MAWFLVKWVYFQSLSNRHLADPIFNDLIKVAMENATFWENMQTLEQSASTIAGNYNLLVSATSKFNNNLLTGTQDGALLRSMQGSKQRSLDNAL